MPSTYTTSGIELIGDGEQTGTWGDTTNDNLQILDRMVSQAGTISLSGTTHTLTISDGVLSDGQYAVLVFGGSPSGTNTVTISPNDAKRLWFVKNSSGQSVILTQGSGGNVTVANGKTAVVYCDGGGSGAAVVALTEAISGVLLTSDIGTTVQGYDAGLADIAGLAVTNGNFLVGDGTNWVAESGDTAIASLGVTATAAELNILDGVTATTAELNILDGVTATATELNLLDGLTGKTGADVDLVTGTAGTDGNLVQWNADGDVVDGPGVIDEDDMASASATDVPTQQSVKAYVDAEVSAITPGAPISWSSWANGSQSTVAHSFGSAPTIWFAYMQCTATDAGFSVGDIVPINYSHSSSGFNGATTYADATNLYLRVGSGGFNTYNSSGTYTSDFDPAKWTAKVRIVA